MRRSIWMITMAFATLLSAGSAYAAAPITVDLNGSRRVMLHGTVQNVFVADPAVADVNMIDTHSVIVLGKGYGVTQVLVTDRSGHALLDSVVAVLGSDAGRVTVYRGEAAQDYHCSSRCETVNGGAGIAHAGAGANTGGAQPPAPTSGEGAAAPTNTPPPAAAAAAPVQHP